MRSWHVTLTAHWADGPMVTVTRVDLAHDAPGAYLRAHAQLKRDALAVDLDVADCLALTSEVTPFTPQVQQEAQRAAA